MNSSPASSDSTLRRWLRRLAKISAILAVVLLILKITWLAVRDSVPPVPVGVLSPRASNGHREWSNIVIHYPGYPVAADDREWSHLEIAQRHKALVLKDLPDYVTELRGSGAIHETDGTGAAWYFVVPRKHLPEFEQYILDLGVTKEALHASMDVPIPAEYDGWADHLSALPAPRLLISRSTKAAGDITIMNMQFAKANDTMTYSLINPSIGRCTIRIRVSWKTGNVQFLEWPRNPDWEK